MMNTENRRAKGEMALLFLEHGGNGIKEILRVHRN